MTDLPLTGTQLFLVRHGQSVANARDIAQGRAEYPLSELGRAQAAATGAKLAAQGPFDAIYSSPQGRADETALAIAAAVGLPVRHDADLVEIDVGKLSGLTWAQFAEQFPAEHGAYQQALAEKPHPRHRELIPGWEPIPLVLERVWRAMTRIVEAHPGGKVVVVAHGGVFNAFLTHLLEGDATETPWRYPSPNCAIHHLLLAPPRATALCLADDAHAASVVL